MDGIYEAAALGMRFWFLAVVILVLLGVTAISIKEYTEKRYVLRIAGSSIGYLHIVSGPEEIRSENLQLMRENTIGRSRRVDIYLRDNSISKAHSQIYLARDGGVYLNRLGRGDVTVNGQPVYDTVPVYSGDMICFGNIVASIHIKEGDRHGT